MTRSSRFRIKITKIGYLFIAICLGVGVAGLNTGNNLLYLIFSMMLSFIVLSGILSNSTLLALDIQPEFPSRIFAKQPVPVRIELRNRKKRLPSFSLSLSAQNRKQEMDLGAFVVKIPPNESSVTTDFVSFPRRGKTMLPPYVIETTYPFGLIRKYTTVPSEGETIVYPEILNLDTLLSSDTRWLGEYLSGQIGGASNPYGIREFVEGDPARLIHWKTSARSGELKVKEFEREKRLKIHLDVRLAPRSEADIALQEKTISAAASLLCMLASRGYEIGMSLNGYSVEPKGRGYIDGYLAALALALPSLGAEADSVSAENIAFITDRSNTSPPLHAFSFGDREKSASYEI